MEIRIIEEKQNIYLFQKDSNNYIHFCPKRGGIITKWVAKSNNILYFDQSRFLDESKSIRGGIPILFPICGNLESRSSIFGTNYKVFKQHGFARDLDWKFKLNEGNNSLILYLENNESTMQYFPFHFELKIEVKLDISSLSFEVDIKNKTNKEMPFNFGLHPYFNISEFHNIQFSEYPLNCQNQKINTLEVTSKELKNLDNGIDLLMYGCGRILLKDFGLNRKITLTNPFPFDINVIWSDPPRKMICLEPWTSPRNSLKEGFRKMILSPNSYKKLHTSIYVNDI